MWRIKVEFGRLIKTVLMQMKDRILQLLRSVMSAEPPNDLISSPKIFIKC